MIECAGIEKTKSILGSFKCNKNQDVANFLIRKSIDFEKRDVTRSYLIVNNLDNANIQIMGYFAIGVKTVNLPKELSASRRKKYDGFNNKATTIECYLIGQLGKNDIYSNMITGEELLYSAIQVIMKCYDLIGGRTILVECQNNEKLKKFYIYNDFIFLQKDKSTELLQYILPINRIKFNKKLNN